MIRRFSFSRTGLAHAPAQTCARFILIASAGCIVLALSTATPAATLPPGFAETMIAEGIETPTAMEFSPDGRLFVCMQDGNLRVIKNGSLLPAPFVKVTVHFTGERGLLGVAFDPDFVHNNFVYLYYTTTIVSIHNRVSRFTANGDVAVPSSEVVLLELEDLGLMIHNGGAIHFGPDGKLYVAVGENGVSSNSQTMTNRLGKVLRINSDGTIPSDNPFFNMATGVNRSIWALGLRNPFTFAFQPGTGRMFINDVGQNTWEEINDGIAGSNYGWPNCEGVCTPPTIQFRDPLFQYGHGETSTTGCAISGGQFYNPATVQFPASYVGKYFFAEVCTGWVRLFDPATNTATDFASGISLPVDLKVASDGSLYYLSFGINGKVFRVQFDGTPPSITTQPTDQTVTQGQPATFTVAASGTTTLTYQWQRNQVNISGATSPSYSIPSTVAADNGAKFRCLVTNNFGTATSNEATLTVNSPPSITTQPTDQTIIQGEPVTFTVAAIGTPTLTYQWQRNQMDISGATSPSYTNSSRVADDNGAKFRCIVTNNFGTATSNEATLTVQPPPPVLITEEGTDIAVALNSVTFFRDPFPLTDPFNFSSDNRTRIMLFATNLALAGNENASAVTARAEDAQMNVYPLTVEHVGPVPRFIGFTEVVVVLPGNLPSGQSILISVTWHLQASNKVRVKIR
jgi:glucose/arabinose dehydrogenase